MARDITQESEESVHATGLGKTMREDDLGEEYKPPGNSFTILIIGKKHETYKWKEYDFSMEVPATALPQGVQARVTINAMAAENLLAKDDISLVSDVFHIKCDEIFQDNVKICIKHKAFGCNTDYLQVFSVNDVNNQWEMLESTFSDDACHLETKHYCNFLLFVIKSATKNVTKEKITEKFIKSWESSQSSTNIVQSEWDKSTKLSLFEHLVTQFFTCTSALTPKKQNAIQSVAATLISAVTEKQNTAKNSSKDRTHTFTLIGSKDHAVYSWEAYGFSIKVPPGALPPGKKVPVKIDVVLYTDEEFSLPEHDMYLVSEIFHIQCQEKFQKEVLIHFKHRALIGDNDDNSHLQIVTAKSSDSHPHKLNFEPVATNIDGSFVMTSVQMFSYYSATNKVFLCTVFYRHMPLLPSYTCWEMILVLIKKDEHAQDIISQLKEQQDLCTGWGDQIDNVYFEKEQIQVKLATEQRDNNLWKFFAKKAEITLKDVIEYDPNFAPVQVIHPPSCVYDIQWKAQSYPGSSHQEFLLSGSRGNICFKIRLPPTSVLPTRSVTTSTGITPIDLATKNEPQLKQLMNFIVVEASSKWREIGIQLEIDDNVLESFPQDISLGGNPQGYLRKVLTTWKNNPKPGSPYTWDTILATLASSSVGYNSLAENIKMKLSSEVTPPPPYNFEQSYKGNCHGAWTSVVPQDSSIDIQNIPPRL